MLTLILLYLAALVSASVDHTVLNTPNVVRAGEPFTIFTNLAAAHWPIPDCQGPGRCDMKYLRVYMMGDPTYETMTDRGGPAIIWRQYCYLEGCVSTDLTSFNTTIPKASFPDGYPYSLDYMLFTPLDNGSISTLEPTFSIFEATTFNLTGATGNWSDFAYQSADYGIEKYVYTVPCSAVPCLQDCQTEFVAPYVPFPRKKGEQLDACVKGCKGDSDPMAKCLTKNATAAAAAETTTAKTSETAATTTTTSTGTASTTGAAPPGNAGSDFKVERMSLVLWLGCFAMVFWLVV